MVSQQRLAWPSRRRLVLSRRARLLDAPRTSAGRPASGSYGEKGPLSAARRPSPLGEGAERSEADEVCRGGSVTRPSRISHIPFSNVRLGGRPKGLPCLIPEELLENRRGGAEGESAEGREKPPWGVPLPRAGLGPAPTKRNDSLFVRRRSGSKTRPSRDLNMFL